MPAPIKLFYKGKSQDFIIFVDSEEAYETYRKDPSSIPLSDVVSTYKVYKTITGSGSEGQLETASKLELAEEFDNEHVEDVLPIIIKDGESLKSGHTNNKRQYSSTNDSRGSFNQ